jgi:Post-segregation antitoxin CcdA
MLHHPPDPVILAEARRLAAEDPDRDLDQVAELLAERGHYSQDGRPYPARTMANLLDEELRRRRDDRWCERNRAAAEAWKGWVEEHGLPLANLDSGGMRDGTADATKSAKGAVSAVNAVPTSSCVPADDYPLTPEKCWFLLRGYRVRPARHGRRPQADARRHRDGGRPSPPSALHGHRLRGDPPWPRCWLGATMARKCGSTSLLHRTCAP